MTISIKFHFDWETGLILVVKFHFFSSLLLGFTVWEYDTQRPRSDTKDSSLWQFEQKIRTLVGPRTNLFRLPYYLHFIDSSSIPCESFFSICVSVRWWDKPLCSKMNKLCIDQSHVCGFLCWWRFSFYASSLCPWSLSFSWRKYVIYSNKFLRGVDF